MIYYIVFRFAITKFDHKTPGREPEEIEKEIENDRRSSRSAGFAPLAQGPRTARSGGLRHVTQRAGSATANQQGIGRFPT
ncbi:hypothetical protein SCYAM73S_05924 [Streptomyces cyaneofuscatus]